MTYVEKLKDPRWQKLRLQIFEKAGWTCRCCKKTTQTLCVHHLIYLNDMEPWDYPVSHLECLCDECHEWREGWNSIFGRSLLSTFFCQSFERAICRPLFDHKWQKRSPQTAKAIIDKLPLLLADGRRPRVKLLDVGGRRAQKDVDSLVG